MSKLLKKEFLLSMHPTAPIMIFLSAMVLIPNYPYSVIFFYISLSVFFTCLLGRENNDVVYSLTLPIAKKDIVKARMGYTIILQFIQMILMIPFVILSQKINVDGNQAGIDAGITLFGVGFFIYGIFNLVFFLSYYKNVNKVGVAFVKASVAIFICVIAEVVSSYAIPFVKNVLETKDPVNISAKLIILALGFLLYLILTLITYKLSVKNFEKQDL